MTTIRFGKRFMVAFYCALALLPMRVAADDIDLFTAATSGSASAPNIIFLIDNSPNWSRSSQHWPDNNGVQGEAEVAAIQAVLASIASNSSQPVNIGIAMLNAYGGDTNNGATPGTGGGYIRFGARDMSQAANRTALDNILGYISNNITSPSEKVSGMSHKDESAAFYEIYKYLAGLTPYTGPVSQNPEADAAGNTNAETGAGQGLTSGFAIGTGGTYQSPLSGGNCGRTYIVYIANNANNTGSSGNSAYQSSIANAAPALTPIFGTSQLDAWTDEWTHFLYSNGVPVSGGTSNRSTVTYVLDAYNAQNNAAYSYLLQAAAKLGGGKYYQVGSQSAITTALLQILAEIQGVSSTFASAALPVNTTNRSQDRNEVFIPMFRPDPNDQPRWMGNLKQYQLINVNNAIELGDALLDPALNTLTGYPADCSTSFWTTDSGGYWANVNETPEPKGNCPTTGNSPYSDSPDGAIVEKGGVAEIIRKGNNPPATNTSPTWAVNRTIYTLSGTSLVPFSTTSSGLSSTLVNYVSGEDVNDENLNGDTTETRPSLHGDAIHSRPLPVDYGGTTGVTTYYGSNDGMLRAVDADTGRERWAFVAPEHFSRFQRLMDNSPLIYYPGMPGGITPTPTRKDYFFDGSIGLYQNADNTKVWIYPSMRRGGRMLYAFDVTNPDSPSFKWKTGCPDMADNTGCTTGMSGIGQTWSTPVVAFIKGYSSTNPVVIVGGGYDTCEDTDTSAPSCTSPTGAAVYVLDADTGALIQTFDTTRSVAADVSVIDLDNDGYIDAAYVADTGGNIYRIDFTSGPSGDFGALSSALWTMHRVAYTNGSGRKFLFAPALLASGNSSVYVAIGSGDREHPLITEYPYTTPVVNRFYVYVDDLTGTTAHNMDDTNEFYDFTGGSTCSTAGVLPTSTHKGWFMDLNQYGQGEQVVTSAVIAAGMVTFSTNRPVPATAGSCANSLGEARGYWINLLNGSGAIGVDAFCGGNLSTIFAGGGLPPSPVVGVVPVDGHLTTVIIGAAQKDGSASGVVSPQHVKPAINSTRKLIYWKFSGVQ